MNVQVVEFCNIWLTIKVPFSAAEIVFLEQNCVRALVHFPLGFGKNKVHHHFRHV